MAVCVSLCAYSEIHTRRTGSHDDVARRACIVLTVSVAHLARYEKPVHENDPNQNTPAETKVAHKKKKVKVMALTATTTEGFRLLPTQAKYC